MFTHHRSSHLHSTTGTRQGERRVFGPLALGLNIGSVLEQYSHHLQMSSGGSEDERGEALLVAMLNIRPVVKQQLHHFRMASSTAQRKCSVSVALSLGVYVHPNVIADIRDGRRHCVLRSGHHRAAIRRKSLLNIMVGVIGAGTGRGEVEGGGRAGMRGVGALDWAGQVIAAAVGYTTSVEA